MLHLALWGILGVVMGIAVLVALSIVGTIAYCTAGVARDIVIGSDGEIWCPVEQRQYHVRGTSRRSLVGVSFSALKRCERWGEGRIQCSESCLKEQPEAFAV